MLYNSHEYYVPGLREYTDSQIPANTYSVKDYDTFVQGHTMLEVGKRRVVSLQYYETIVGFQEEKEKEKDDSLSDDFADIVFWIN